MFQGQRHFNYHKKDGAQSNSLGFVFIMLFELPILHMLLHYLWSPMAANIVTMLTLMSIVFFIAEYRAMIRRPISLDNEFLIVRYGLWNVKKIPLENIEYVKENHEYVKRSSHVKRFNFSGIPNVMLGLKQEVDAVDIIYLGIDEVSIFIKEIQEVLTRLE